MSEFGAPYTQNGSWDFVHHYGYTKNIITTDTTYSVVFNLNPTASGFKYISYLSYDDFNRVSRDSVVQVPQPGNVFVLPPYVKTYQYDQDGNLLNSGLPPYDKKMNPHKTYKVWMFVDRNYSVNNRAPEASTYNSVGLPLLFPVTPGASFQFAAVSFNLANRSVQIEYDCK